MASVTAVSYAREHIVLLLPVHHTHHMKNGALCLSFGEKLQKRKKKKEKEKVASPL